MTSLVSFTGAKGGGGSFKNRPDTLRSDDSFELVFGLGGAGPWKGLKNGLQSLYINSVPVEDENRNSNFKDIVTFFADGDPTQTQIVTFKLGGGTGTSIVNVMLANKNTSAPGGWVNAAVTTPGADHIDLRFVVQQLYDQNKSGTFDAVASIEIEMKPSGYNNWTNVFAANPTGSYNPYGIDTSTVFGKVKVLLIKSWYTPDGAGWLPDPNAGRLVINGKTTTPYVREIRIAVPNDGPYANRTWQIRCRLVEVDTVDADKNQTRRLILWESVGASIATQWGADPAWRGLSWLQIYGLASDQINGTPTVEGIYDTKICSVPPSTVFNPITRQYTGVTWDGSYNLQFTDDPAWCMKTFIEDSVAGVAALAPGSTLNKWDALEASKYYSELVPDGSGGTHPRFSMNVNFNQPQAVEDAVQYLAGAVNSLAWEEAPGKWRLKVAKPEVAVAVFTPENIVGEFNYSHTDVDTRFNDITMTYLDEANLFEQNRVRVYDQADIDLNGRRPTTLVAIGAKHRQEALRRAKFRLSTTLNETQLVNFVTNRQGLMVEKYSSIYIADPDFGNITTTGRLTSVAGTTLVCRDPVRLEIGVVYKIVITVPNPNYQSSDSTTLPAGTDWRQPTLTITRNIVNTTGQRGNVNTLYIDTALPANTPAFAVFALSAPGLPALPVPFQVTDIEPMDDENGQLVRISGLNIYTNKWSEMDNVTEAAVFGQSHYSPPKPPTNLVFSLSQVLGDVVAHTQLGVQWSRPTSGDVSGYRVEYSFNGGPFTLMDPRLFDTNYEIGDPTPGTYAFKISTLDRKNNTSLPLTGSFQVTEAVGRNKFGPLANRPLTGNLEGDRYTVNDTVPRTTYVWTSGAWVQESNLVTQGTDIGVDNGATRNVNRGVWSSAGVAYLKGDIVQFGSPVSSYITSANHTSTASNGPGTALWVLFAASGTNGTNGTNGVNGTNGTNGTTLYTWIAYSDAPNGSVNFTTGTPGNRSYIGIAANQVTPTEGTLPGAYDWSPYRGPAAFGLVASGLAVISSNRILATTALTAYGQGGVYSSESYTGACSLAFTVDAGAQMYVGLNSDPTTDNAFASIDYSFRFFSNSWYIVESGTDRGYAANYTNSTIFQILYDGKQIRYLVDGVTYRTVPAAANLKFFVDSTFGTPGYAATLLGWTAGGLAGTDGTNGTNGTPGATGPAGPTGPTGPTAPAPTPVVNGTSTIPNTVWMAAGASISVTARMVLLSGASGGAGSIQLQARPYNTGSFANIAGGYTDVSVEAGSPASGGVTTTFTNATGADGLFEFAVVSSSAGRTINASKSYMKVG